jgi:hypothetical protein
MNFQSAEPNEVLQIFRLLSTEGKWELGFRQMLFGMRVSLSQIGDCYYTLDYCAADDPGFALTLLLTVMKILERYPENVTPRQLQNEFPRCDRKPMNLDPCWLKLQEMAKDSVGAVDG